VVIPKPIVTEFNLAIIVLPLVFKRTPKILLSKSLTRVAIEVLFAFPYQLAFLVVGFYGGAYFFLTAKLRNTSLIYKRL